MRCEGRGVGSRVGFGSTVLKLEQEPKAGVNVGDQDPITYCPINSLALQHSVKTWWASSHFHIPELGPLPLPAPPTTRGAPAPTPDPAPLTSRGAPAPAPPTSSKGAPAPAPALPTRRGA